MGVYIKIDSYIIYKKNYIKKRHNSFQRIIAPLNLYLDLILRYVTQLFLIIFLH